jgi:hypothetical protein
MIAALLVPAPAALAAAPPRPVAGWIDAIRYIGDQYYVFGWACQQGNRGAIDITVFGDKAPVVIGKADMENEPAVDRACGDADGGKHRFKIELPNQLLRSFQGKALYVHGIADGGNVDTAIGQSGKFRMPAPKWPPDPPTPDFLDGQRVAAFDSTRDGCDKDDIPDEAASAFRDYRGTIHLFASHSVNRADLGSTLETTRHKCQVVYNSHHDANPADFDDDTWVSHFYSVDGRKIVAAGHMEYHGDEHPGAGMCASKTPTIACWYNVSTFLTSEDGGYHFTSPRPPANYLVGLPYKYQVNQGPEGYSFDANPIKVGPWFYAKVSGWPWPPQCGGGKGQRPCLVPDGSCPVRTDNILDPASWRGWDGKDFTVTFVDPYRGPVANPQSHVCAIVPYIDYAQAIAFHPASHLFVATLWNQGSGDFGPKGVYFSTSADFVHWSRPALAMTENQMLRREPVVGASKWSYGYFSLIDPKATDASFATITDHPYLYYVRIDDYGELRVLFRQQVKLSWLAALHPKDGASAGKP